MNNKAVRFCFAFAICISLQQFASAQPADAVQHKEVQVGQLTYLLNADGSALRTCATPDLVAIWHYRTGLPLPGASIEHNVASDLKGPTGMAVDSKGFLYIASRLENTIKKFWMLPGRENVKYRQTTVFAHTDLNRPTRLAFDTQDNLYVVNSGDDTIFRFASNGDGKEFAHHSANNIADMTCDNAGNLYLSNSQDRTVEMLSKEGVATQVVGPGLNSTPTALTFDSRDNLYVLYASSVGGRGIIQKRTPAGVVTNYTTVTFAGPYQMAFDTDGILNVLCSGDNAIMKVRPNGTGWTFVTWPSSFIAGPVFAVASGHVKPLAGETAISVATRKSE